MTEEKHRGLRMWREVAHNWSHWEPRSVQELGNVGDSPLSEWFTQAGIRPMKAMNAKMLGFVFQCSFDYPSVWDHVRDFSDSLDYDLYYAKHDLHQSYISYPYLYQHQIWDDFQVKEPEKVEKLVFVAHQPYTGDDYHRVHSYESIQELTLFWHPHVKTEFWWEFFSPYQFPNLKSVTVFSPENKVNALITLKGFSAQAPQLEKLTILTSSLGQWRQYEDCWDLTMFKGVRTCLGVTYQREVE